jgi:hypothetical protein
VRERPPIAISHPLISSPIVLRQHRHCGLPASLFMFMLQSLSWHSRYDR